MNKEIVVDGRAFGQITYGITGNNNDRAMSPVEQSCANLDRSIDHLAKTVENLQQRLGSVISPFPQPGPETENLCRTVEAARPARLAGQIDAMAERLSHHVDRLELIYANLEI